MSGTNVNIIAGNKVVLDKLKEIQNIRIDQAKELKPIASGALPSIPASPANQDYKMYVSGGKTGATFTGVGLPGGSVTLTKSERGCLWFDKDTRAWELLDVQELPEVSIVDSFNSIDGDKASSARTVNVLNSIKINASEKGKPLGLATLDFEGKIPINQLRAGGLTYKGLWNASKNIPFVTNGVGTDGDFYVINTSGSQNLGTGNIDFTASNLIYYYNGIWEQYNDNNEVGPAYYNDFFGE